MYSARYISDRFLPDKAIDLVDEAASALRLAQESKPDALEALEREIVTLQIELESLKKETDVFSVERRSKVESDLALKKEEASALTREWQAGEDSNHFHTLRYRTHRSLKRTGEVEQDQRHQETACRSQTPTGSCSTRRPIRTCVTP